MNRLQNLRLAILFCLAVAAAFGCRDASGPDRSEKSTAPKSRRPLRVLVIDDPELADVLERQWLARSETRIEVSNGSTREIETGGRGQLAADVVIYPSGLIGELAERGMIEPVPQTLLDAPEFAQRDIFDLPRLVEARWGEDVMAVPLGSPQLVLLYRVDIFEKLGLQPPESWDEYLEIAGALASRADLGELAPAAGEPWQAVCEPLDDGWAGPLLLARSAAFARHRSQYSTLFDRRTLTPLISGPPFVRALENLVQTYQRSRRDGAENNDRAGWGSPADVRKAFLRGECGMAITWPGPATTDTGESVEHRIAIGIAPLPGSADVFNFRENSWESRDDSEPTYVPLVAAAGRLASLTRQGRRSDVALTLLQWLGGPELSGIIAPASKATAPFRESHLTQIARWVGPEFDDETAGRYAEVLRTTQNVSSALTTLRIPGRQDYLGALDQAVRAAVREDLPAQEALELTAAAWDEITDKRGREAQTDAYTRSIGLKP